MPAGYSGTPLARKLGIQAGHRVRQTGLDRGLVDNKSGIAGKPWSR